MSIPDCNFSFFVETKLFTITQDVPRSNDCRLPLSQTNLGKQIVTYHDRLEQSTNSFQRNDFLPLFYSKTKN